jgi:glycosyltransferase involved in cell wall biosynthesis
MRLLERLRHSAHYRVFDPAEKFSRRVSLEWQRFKRRPDRRSRALRQDLRKLAGLPARLPDDRLKDGFAEFEYLCRNHRELRPAFEKLAGKRVLFVGQAYYNSWYLSRALRRIGWSADLLNWDTNPASQIYYHGEDFRFTGEKPDELEDNLAFFLDAIYKYDIFHFSNAHAICFGLSLQREIATHFGSHAEIHLLRDLGKKIVYSNNGCLDGVSKTSFATWGDVPVCTICRWRNEPSVCSDERNLQWGRFRNTVADYQCLLGGNRIDFNDAATVHEVPEFYCLRPDVWRPDLQVSARFRLPPLPPDGVRLYHGVGDLGTRTDSEGVNIKSSHIYRPLVEKLRSQGYMIDLLEPTGVPNLDIRFFQVQADIFIDMLTYGWFGATAREGMMLGKPVVCYIRPEWLESLRQEIPAYAAELPIVNATPETIEQVLTDLITNPDKRREIGKRSRAFAVKWHSDSAGARRFDQIYSRLLEGDLQLRRINA